MKSRKYIIFIILLFSKITFSQSIENKIVCLDSSCIKEYQWIKKAFDNSKEKKISIQKSIFTLYEKGFLMASIDSIKKIDSLTQTIFLRLGNKYTISNFDVSAIDRELLLKAKYRERNFRYKHFNYQKLKALQENILLILENEGFPFAQIRLDSFEVSSNNTLSTKLLLEKGSPKNIDTIIIKGNAKINNHFFQNYIGIKQHSLYNESLIQSLSYRINELGFIKEIKPADVVFTKKDTKLILYIDTKKANQFDGLIGFLPNPSTGKLLITGQAHIKLMNSFSHGELIDLNWRRFQFLSQDLVIKFTYPFLFNSPLGVDYSLRFFKRDTTFLEINQQLGLLYLLSGNNYFKVFMNDKNSNILSQHFTSNTYTSTKTRLYGIGLKHEKIDYRLNPKKGNRLQLNVSTGKKNIAIKEQDTTNTAPIKTIQYTFDALLDFFIPISNKLVGVLNLKSAGLVDPYLFNNDLLRIGGYNTLRGFDEESILTSGYTIANVECRYLLDKNSNVFIFYNQCWYEKNSISGYKKDNPFGFGAGLTMDTKAGMFSLMYALGREHNNPIDLRSAKIHFGITSVF